MLVLNAHDGANYLRKMLHIEVGRVRVVPRNSVFEGMMDLVPDKLFHHAFKSLNAVEDHGRSCHTARARSDAI
jgi:hypothetical protein